MCKKILLVCAFAVSTLFGQSVLGCSCAGGGLPCQAYGNTAAVFIGTPIAVGQTTIKRSGDGRDYDFPQRVFTFRVDESFKGVDAAQVQVMTGQGGGDCGYDFKIGVSYIVYAGRNPKDNSLVTGICTRTRPLSEASEDVDYIRSLPNRGGEAVLYGQIRRYRTNPETEGNVAMALPGKIEILVEGEGQSFRALTDEEGNYKLSGLAPGKYKVKPLLPENLSTYETQREISLNEGGCGNVSFYVTDNGRILGRVFDANGQPVPRIMVDLIPVSQVNSEHPHIIFKSADDEGRFELKLVPPGQYLLGIRLNGLNGPDDPVTTYPRTYYPGTARAQDAAIISVGESQEVKGLELRLLPRLTERIISGKVVMKEGRPVAHAMVAREETVYTVRGLGYAIQTDEQGNFSFKGYEGISYHVTAYTNNPNEQQMYAEPVDVPPTGEVKDLRLVINKPK